MHSYTIHAAAPRPASVPATAPAALPPPRLLREGFAWGAFLFGPFWFAWHRCWLAAAAMLALTALALALPPGAAPFALAALQVLAGFEARDILRRRLARRGLPEQGVVVAPDAGMAWFRLGQQRPELIRALP